MKDKKNRAEVEEAENGFVVKCWCYEDDKMDEYGYMEPEVYVASDIEEVLKILKEELA